jgi:predicted nucleic acid-binding protein
MTMGAKAFVDTNVLLRAFHNTFPEHARARAMVDRMLDDGNELWISRQVLREYLVQATSPRTFVEPLSIDTVLKQLEGIRSVCRVADETELVTSRLLELLKTHPTQGKQVHDANIVATMLAYDIDTLLSINIEDMKRFADKIKLVTLENEPDS